MADIRVNSQGNDITDGDGSGINAGILDAIRAIRYVSLAWAIAEEIEESNLTKAKQLPEASQEEDKAIEGEDIIDAEWTDNDQKQIAAKEQKLLVARDFDDQIQGHPLNIEKKAIPKREDLFVEMQVGSFHVSDSYDKLERRLNSLTFEQKASLKIAVAGGLPRDEVFIQVTDKQNRSFIFHADSEQNSGWVSEGQRSLKFSSLEMREELSRQDSLGVTKIRDTMREAFDNESDPWVFEGEKYTVLADAETVIVIGETGLVKDVTELNDIGEKGWNAAEQVREAQADFNLATSGATTGHRPPKRQRQVELTQ